jgi:two-component system nitrate/nitrite response regulator NarL
MHELSNKRILVCDSQPLAVEGIRWLLQDVPGLEFGGGVASLEAALELLRGMAPAAIVVDRSVGVIGLLGWLHQLSASGCPTAVVVWGNGITETEALRLLQAGARGIVARSTDPATLIHCLYTVLAGNSYLEQGLFGDSDKFGKRRTELTSREAEIAVMIQDGLKNREIARLLGIQLGTVKIHVRHIFEKTGVRGRYGLLLTNVNGKIGVPRPVMRSLPGTESQDLGMAISPSMALTAAM